MIESWIDIPNLQTVHLPNSFHYVQSIETTSICTNMNEWIDISTVLDDLFPFTLDDLNINSKSIIIPSKSYNTVRGLAFSQYNLLEELVIGDSCFRLVDKFVIDGLNKLKSLKIGSDSFTHLKSDDKWDWRRTNNCNRSFRIMSCAKLESIEIGRYSFSDYGGGFELKKLPKLSTIKLGSSSFYSSSFVIKGIINMILLMNRSPTFEFYWIRWLCIL